MKYALIAAVAAVALAGTAPIASAQMQDHSLVVQLHQELSSKGYDTSGFSNLTLSQVSLIKNLMEQDEAGSRRTIQGILNGVCGQAVIPQHAMVPTSN